MSKIKRKNYMSEEKNIKQENRFDEQYRRSLGTMKVEPSARTWNRMSRQLLWGELLRFNFSNLPGYAWVIAAAVAVILGSGIYWIASDRSAEPPAAPIVAETPTGPAIIQPATPLSTPAAKTSEENSPTQVDASSPAVRTAAVSHMALKTKPSEPAAARLESPNSSPVQATTISMAPAPLPIGLPLIDLLEPESFTFIMPATGSLFLPVPNPKPAMKPMYESTPASNQIRTAWNLGLNITPDIVFYRSTSEYFKYDYTLDAAVQYDIGRFYLQSALGISWSSDIGNYAISANKNDSVGFYYAVTSFTEVPGDPGYLEYTTSMNTVYDTNQYVYDYSTKNTYTYLEVPLVVGYRAVVRPTWSLALDAGGFWSGLIGSNEPVPAFYIPEGRVTSVENTTPARRKSSFGLLGSIRFEYIFGKKFSLIIAPTFKYHLNSIEDQSIPGATQPWSIGFRAGIWYRIDLNK
jgi:hypothetical protein